MTIQLREFNRVLLNTLLASTTNNFLWFAITFWMYLETRSVIANAFIGAMYPIFTALFSVFFGTYVDHHKKKQALALSTILTLGFFIAGGIVYAIAPEGALFNLRSAYFWSFIVLIMGGAMAGGMRMIALSTLVTLLVPEKDHDKANGKVGAVNGVSFAITSVFSGLAIATVGMGWSLAIAIVLTALSLIHLSFIRFKESIAASEEKPKKVDFVGAINTIKSVPGLSALIFFSLLNNFLGGVFFALMDPYGLELVSVQTWGLLWGILSISFLLGGILVARKGLGLHPLKRLFQANILMWIAAGLFPIQASILLAGIGMFIYMVLIPVAEAAEQTVLQKVVPASKQGRVFGFSSMVENMASPVTALAIGPIAQGVFIPLMTDGGTGARTIGSWFGTGVNRGIALIFIIASILGLLVTLIAFRSRAYAMLSKTYHNTAGHIDTDDVPPIPHFTK